LALAVESLTDERNTLASTESPCVENPTMYVMYILGDGTAAESGTTQIAIGPLAEIILRVVPNGLCT